MHAWTIGDDITTHPRYEDHVNLELEMREGGANLFTKKLTKAMDKKRMASMEPYRATIKRWLPIVAEHVKDFTRRAKLYRRKMGILSPTSLQYLEQIDPYMAALFTLRAIMDRMASGQCQILGLSRSIGEALENEARMEAWEKQEPELYYWNERQFELDGATSIHRRRVNVAKLNRLQKDGKLQWIEWPRDHVNRLGTDLLNIAMQATAAFRVEDDITNTFTPGKPRSPAKLLVMDEKVQEALLSQLGAMKINSPVYQPTLIPPKRWDGSQGEGRGGYWTEMVRAPKLIRFRASQQVQQQNAQMEYEALAMERPMAALHAVQETPWRINKVVLAAMNHIWDHDLATAGLPFKGVGGHGLIPLPEPRPPEELRRKDPPKDILEAWPPERILAWRREAAPIHKANRQNVSKVLSTQRIIDIANRFQDETFYFPHMFDFRGRMYPIPADLQPQGTDISRGLLTFAEGKPVGIRGIAWLAVHLANVSGYDKVSYEERVDWAYERMDTWTRIYEDPIGSLKLWAQPTTKKKGGSSFQVLAAAVEFVRAVHEGEDYISALPVRVDGTCNGIQHLAAMTRNRSVGASVNLTPPPEDAPDKPRDIYGEVGELVLADVERIAVAGGEESDKARWWLEILGGPEGGHPKVPRDLAKRPVMILPYGGTKEAYWKYTRDWLAENHPWTQDRDKLDQRLMGSNVRFMTNRLEDAVRAPLAPAMEIMEWLQDCAKKAAVGNQPIFWTTPSGFLVRHFYGKMKKHEVVTRLQGERFRLIEWLPTDVLDRKEQLQGISPNFVHSMDGAAMQECMVVARENGIGSLTAIHDSFGTVAADMDKLHAILREAFVWVHEQDVLSIFRKGCQEVLAGHLMYVERMSQEDAWARADQILPAPLPYQDLDLSQVKKSAYFFA